MAEKQITTISAQVDKALADKVRKKAKKKDLTLSQVIRRALREFTRDDDSEED